MLITLFCNPFISLLECTVLTLSSVQRSPRKLLFYLKSVNIAFIDYRAGLSKFAIKAVKPFCKSTSVKELACFDF